jgi:hypothetical protein
VGNPLSKQRSPWQRGVLPDVVERAFAMAHLEPTYYERHVHDGILSVIICEEPAGWHLSISHIFNHGRYGRYPSWDEIAHARYTLLPVDIDFVMHLPPPDEFVAVHDTTFHLWQYFEREGEQ